MHLSCWDDSKFIPCTADAYADMCARIESLYRSGAPRKEREEMEKDCGIKYEANGAMFDSEVRNLLRFPETVFWDWQHNLLSSSGVAQYICNDVCRQIVGAGVASLSDLDEFASTIKCPKELPPLKKTFFQDRISMNAGAHMKAFASETIMAVVVLGVFADLVLTPAGLFSSHVVLLAAMRKVLDLLRLGDAVVARVDELGTELKNLHKSMIEVIPECAKTKPHLLRHIWDSIHRFKRNFSCFGPERRHRLGKSVASTHYKNGFTSMLNADLHDLRVHFADPDTYKPTALVKPCALPGLADFFKDVISVSCVYGSRKARTPRGTFSSDEVLLLLEDGAMRVAMARLFLKLITASGRAIYMCVLQVLPCVHGCVFRSSEGHPTFYSLEVVRAHCCYQELSGDCVRVILPTVL